jgi:hypothetical protein
MSSRQFQLFILSFFATFVAGTRSFIKTEPVQAQSSPIFSARWYPPKVRDDRQTTATAQEACSRHRENYKLIGVAMIRNRYGVETHAICHYENLKTRIRTKGQIRATCPKTAEWLSINLGLCISTDAKAPSSSGRKNIQDYFILRPGRATRMITGFEPSLDKILLVGFKNRATPVQDNSGMTTNLVIQGHDLPARIKGVQPWQVSNALIQYPMQ